MSPVTETAAYCAEALIEEDHTITLRFLALELGLTCGNAHTIVHEELGRSRKFARSVPHQLMPEQKETRVAMCREWLQKFEPNRSKRFSGVVTADE